MSALYKLLCKASILFLNVTMNVWREGLHGGVDERSPQWCVRVAPRRRSNPRFPLRPSARVQYPNLSTQT